MKKKIRIYLCWCLLPLLACSCGSDAGHPIETVEKPVALRSGISQTRAPINVFNNTPVQILRGAEAGSFIESWPAMIASSGEVTFTPKQLYPLDNEPVYLRGFYPEPKEVVTGQQSTYTYDMTSGDTDIMASNLLVGAYSDPITDPMKFEHLTSRIEIQVINDGTFPVFRKITKVALHGLQVNASLDLLTNELTFTGNETPVVVYEDAVGIPVVANNYITIGKMVMIQPGATQVEVEFVIDGGTVARQPLIFSRATDLNGQLSGDATPQKGVAYRVSFLFTSFSLIPAIKVVPWKEGGTAGDIIIW